MADYGRRIGSALAAVYQRWPYTPLSVLITTLVFSANVLLPNYRIISDARLALTLLRAAPSTMATASFVMLIIMSVLSGIVASMAVFALLRQLRAATGASSILLSFVAPSCPSCAVGLAGMLGLGGFLGALPFAGLELGMLGIIALLVSIFYLSGKITTATCPLEKRP